MKTFETISDLGSIKIGNDGVAFYFQNDFGDGVNIVEIFEDGDKLETNDLVYLDCFEVLGPGVFLYKYDCSPERKDRIYEFVPGHFMVYRKSPGHLIIKQVLVQIP